MSAIRDLCEQDGTVTASAVAGGGGGVDDESRSVVGSEIMNNSIRGQFRNTNRPGLARMDRGKQLESLLGGDQSVNNDSFHTESGNSFGGNSFEIDTLGTSQHSGLGFSNHSGQRNSLLPASLGRAYSVDRAGPPPLTSLNRGLSGPASGIGGNPQAPYTKSTQPARLQRGSSLGSSHHGSPALAKSLHGNLGEGQQQNNAASMALSRRESTSVVGSGMGNVGGISRRGSLTQSLHGGGNPSASLHGGLDKMWPKSGPLGPVANSSRKSKRTSLIRQQSNRRTLRGVKSKQPLIDEDGNESVMSLTNGRQDVPYFEKLCQICEEIEYPYEYADIVGSQFLGLDGASPVTHVEGHVPTINELVEFLSQAFICITNYSDLSLIFVDDFQWVDSFTWKIFRELCERGKKMLLICAMRSHDKQALRRLSTAITQSHMQSQMIEISLGPLDLLEIREMIAKVLGYGEDAVDESLCSDIYQKTGGLPVYVAELLENIKRNKTVAIDDGGILRWTAQAEQEQVRIFCWFGVTISS